MHPQKRVSTSLSSLSLVTGWPPIIPDELITGLQCPMFTGEGNHEYRNMSSAIETRAPLTEFDNVTTSTSILVMDTLGRQSLVLSHNETIVIPHTLSLHKTVCNRVGSGI